MGGGEVQNRKFTRIFFQASDKINGVCAFPDNQNETLAANVMNLSEGGLCLTIDRDEIMSISKDEHLILLELREDSEIMFNDEIVMIVRWVMDNKFFQNIELGCEFLTIEEKTVEKIREIVGSGVV